MSVITENIMNKAIKRYVEIHFVLTLKEMYL